VIISKAVRTRHQTTLHSNVLYVAVLLLLNVKHHQATYESEINCINYTHDNPLSALHKGVHELNYKGIIMSIKHNNFHFSVNVSYQYYW